MPFRNSEYGQTAGARLCPPGGARSSDAVQLFFDGERYDLSSVGRVKMNMRLNMALEDYEPAEDSMRTLRKDDIVGVMKVILDLKDGQGEVDDIDNLGNRRVRSVGELMENNYRIGLVRMERAAQHTSLAALGDGLAPGQSLPSRRRD